MDEWPGINPVHRCDHEFKIEEAKNGCYSSEDIEILLEIQGVLKNLVNFLLPKHDTCDRDPRSLEDTLEYLYLLEDLLIDNKYRTKYSSPNPSLKHQNFYFCERRKEQRLVLPNQQTKKGRDELEECKQRIKKLGQKGFPPRIDLEERWKERKKHDQDLIDKGWRYLDQTLSEFFRGRRGIIWWVRNITHRPRSNDTQRIFNPSSVEVSGSLLGILGVSFMTSHIFTHLFFSHGFRYRVSSTWIPSEQHSWKSSFLCLLAGRLQIHSKFQET